MSTTPAGIGGNAFSTGYPWMAWLVQYHDLAPSQRAVVDDHLLQLQDDRARAVMRLRFGLDDDAGPRTLGDVGDRLALTVEQVRQFEAWAVKRLDDAEWPAFSILGWRATAEILLLQVERLIEQADDLEQALRAAHLDLVDARVQIGHLQDLNSMLRRELYETRGRESRAVVGGVATILVSLLAGMLGGVGQEATGSVLDHVLEAKKTASVVVVDCSTPSAGHG